jgi:hypothetical protein
MKIYLHVEVYTDKKPVEKRDTSIRCYADGRLLMRQFLVHENRTYAVMHISDASATPLGIKISGIVYEQEIIISFEMKAL